MRRLCLELAFESLQIISVNVRHRPVVKVRVDPVQKLIALARHRVRGADRIRSRRPNKQVNEMLSPLINQSRYRPVIEIIKTSPNQGKSVAGKVDHRRCKIELCVQPRLHRVLVRGSYVSEMVCHQRTHMTGDELRRQELIGPGSLQSGHHIQNDNRSKNDRCRQA